MTKEELNDLKIGDPVFVYYSEACILQGKFRGELGGALLIGVIKEGKEAYQTNFPRFQVFRSEREALRQVIKSYIDEKVSPIEDEAKAADERLNEVREKLNKLQSRLKEIEDRELHLEWIDAMIEVLRKVPGGRFVQEAANFIDVINKWKKELAKEEKQDND